jgi:hypothetical protein
MLLVGSILVPTLCMVALGMLINIMVRPKC